MIFTKEDFKKIELYLKKNSYKDSDFSTIETVTGNDKIPIVHYEGEGNTAENVLMAISTIAEYALLNAIPLLKDEIIAFISEYISTPSYGAPLTHICHINHDDDEPEGTVNTETFTVTSSAVKLNFDCLMKNSDSEEVSVTSHAVALPLASNASAGIINSTTYGKINTTALQLNQHISAARLALTNENHNGLNDAGSIITGNTPIAPGIYAVDNSGTIHDSTDANTYTGTLYYYRRNDNGVISHWLTFITRSVCTHNNGFIGTDSDKVTRIYSTHKEGSGLKATQFTSWQLISIPMVSLEMLNEDLNGVELIDIPFGTSHVYDEDKIVGALLWTEGSKGTQQQVFQTNYKYNQNDEIFELDLEDVAFRTYLRTCDEEERWSPWEISGQMPENTYLTIADYQTDSLKFLTGLDVSKLYVPATINSAGTEVTFMPPHYSYIKDYANPGGIELYGVLQDGTVIKTEKMYGNAWFLKSINGQQIGISNWNWNSNYYVVITLSAALQTVSSLYRIKGNLQLSQLGASDIDDINFDRSEYDVYDDTTNKLVGKLIYMEFPAQDAGVTTLKKSLTFHTYMDLDTTSDVWRFVAPDDSASIEPKVYYITVDAGSSWDQWVKRNYSS